MKRLRRSSGCASKTETYANDNAAAVQMMLIGGAAAVAKRRPLGSPDGTTSDEKCRGCDARVPAAA